MFAETDRRSLNFMITAASFSPLVYGLIAFVIENHPLGNLGNLQNINTFFLFISFTLLLVSRLVENRLVPFELHEDKIPQRRIVVASLLLAGMAEAIAFLGLVIVVLGAGISAFAPFFLLSVLAFVDFRVFRFPRLLEALPEQDPPHGAD